MRTKLKAALLAALAAALALVTIVQRTTAPCPCSPPPNGTAGLGTPACAAAYHRCVGRNGGGAVCGGGRGEGQQRTTLHGGACSRHRISKRCRREIARVSVPANYFRERERYVAQKLQLESTPRQIRAYLAQHEPRHGCALPCRWRDAEFSGGVIRATEPARAKERCLLFVAVMSDARVVSQEKRAAARASWLRWAAGLSQESGAWTSGSQGHVGVVARFFVGERDAADPERSAAFEDDVVVLPGVPDDYRSLSLKTVRIMEYVDSQFDPRYTIKVDDDSFLRLDTLVRGVLPKLPKSRLYWGRFLNSLVLSNKRHKWANTELIANVWPFYYYAKKAKDKRDVWYPAYAAGEAYLLSQDLVRHVVGVATSFPLFMGPIEDAAVGLWLSPLHITRTSVHALYGNAACSFKDKYECHDDMLVLHKPELERSRIKPTMVEIYRSVSDGKGLCYGLASSTWDVRKWSLPGRTPKVEVDAAVMASRRSTDLSEHQAAQLDARLRHACIS